MHEHYEQLLRQHARQGIVVDSNILLLFFVGRCDPRLISTFKRTRAYTPIDFQNLSAILGRFDRIITTPNILTEVSNLSNQLPDSLMSNYFATWPQWLTIIDERYEQSSGLVQRREFSRFGLTDASIIRLAMDLKMLVLTDDFKLSQLLLQAGAASINFNHLRQWLLD